MRITAVWASILLAGCNLLPEDETDPAGCAQREAFWLDADGDGVGDGTDVFVGCEPPGPEWVTVAPTTSPPEDTSDTSGS